MRIRRIRVYSVALPVKDGRYAWSKGKSISTVDTSIVRVDTDTGELLSMSVRRSRL